MELSPLRSEFTNLDAHQYSYMHRRPLLDMLDRYQAAYPGEEAMAERIRSLVERHADCFDRTCRPGHITGSAWVLSADRQRCVLVHHRKLQRWLQPGGHADGDADVLRVAMKEAEEETGLGDLVFLGNAEQPTPLDIDVHQIPARHAPSGELIDDAHEHHDLRFLLAATGEAPPIVSEESHDVRWFKPAEIEQMTDEESVLRLLRKSEPHRG
ncbi:MAG: NUDIX hydrolase [Planctomycetota bacterium]